MKTMEVEAKPIANKLRKLNSVCVLENTVGRTLSVCELLLVVLLDNDCFVDGNSLFVEDKRANDGEFVDDIFDGVNDVNFINDEDVVDEIVIT